MNSLSVIVDSLVNSRTGQFAKISDLQFRVYYSCNCSCRQRTLFMHCQYSIGLELGW